MVQIVLIVVQKDNNHAPNLEIFLHGSKGVQWLLRNQLADGSWFVPTSAVPVQPHTFESFPNGWHQFISDAASVVLGDDGVTLHTAG